MAAAVLSVQFTAESLPAMSALYLHENMAPKHHLNDPPHQKAIRSVCSSPVLQWTHCSSWTGVYGDINSRRRRIPRTGLKTNGLRLISSDVWFPKEPALWLSAVVWLEEPAAARLLVAVWLKEPAPARLSVVVWPKEPAPAQLDLVLKESSFPEEEVPRPKF